MKFASVIDGARPDSTDKALVTVVDVGDVDTVPIDRTGAVAVVNGVVSRWCLVLAFTWVSEKDSSESESEVE